MNQTNRPGGYVVAVGPNDIDEYYECVQPLVVGDKCFIRQLSVSPGGLTANSAVILSAFGTKTYLLDSLGDDQYTPMLLEDLRSHGIDTDYIEVLPGEENIRAQILLSGNEKTVLLYENHKPFITMTPQKRELMEGATPAYSRFSSVEETLDYLGEAMLQDFPATENLTCQIRPVDESMKDNFSPAAYLKSRIDKPLGSPQMIYINGEYSTDLVSTIAHEGYPGHMYQNTYFQNLQLPTIRYMIDYNGYSEGWATYVENSSYKYATEDRELAELYSYNDRYTQCVIALADIGLHYDGWNYDQFAAFLKTYFGDEMDDEVLRSQFYLNLETPTNYLQYYLTGMAYQDLYDGAEEQLGERFSPVEFNRVLLETGPASLDILQQQVDSYVKTAKGGAQKAA